MRARMVLGDAEAALSVLQRALKDVAPDAEAAARLISVARELGLNLTQDQTGESQ